MNDNTDAGEFSQVERSTTPSRYDICRIYVTGVIGTEPKETYLSNNHYVMNFALATTGHFNAIHDWEKYKPAETMWVSMEIWDDVARAAKEDGTLRKGGNFSGMGTLILNKWKDKTTGEEKKMLKVRVLEILTREAIGFMGLDDNIEKSAKMNNDEDDMWPRPDAKSMESQLRKSYNGRDPRIPF